MGWGRGPGRSQWGCAPLSPALANDGFPPAKYDIGGDTEAQVIQNLNDMFGSDEPPLIGVPYGQALARVRPHQMERYGTLYPAANDGGVRGGMPDPRL